MTCASVESERRGGGAAAHVTWLLWAPLVVCVACSGAPASDTSSIPACPQFDEGSDAGHVEHPGLIEASGLVSSDDDLYWSHNDSGSGAELFALGHDGRDRGVIALSDVTPVDIEDIARASGTIYLADTGDNDLVREHVTIYSLPEPLPPGAQGGTATAVALQARYPDGPRNAEALLADPITGDLFILTKDMGGATEIFRYPAPQSPGQGVTLERVGTLHFGSDALPGVALLTGGDISADGSRIALRTYVSVFVWQRNGTVAETLAGPACVASSQAERQGEAIAWRADGTGYTTVSEGNNPTLWAFREL